MNDKEVIIQDDSYVVQEGFFFALISYVFFLVVLALLFKKENRFALFHAKQGLVLFVLETAIIILRMLIGGPLSFVYKFSMLLFIFVSLWGIFSVLVGKYKRLPLIGNIAERIIL